MPGTLISRVRSLVVGVAVMLVTGVAISAQDPRTTPADLTGVYQAIASGVTLPGGLRNAGSPEDIMLLPEATEIMKGIDLARDPEKMCQPIGPFRMMAREGTKIELAAIPGRGLLVMLFEDISRGNLRTVFLGHSHSSDTTPTWLGRSRGRWEGSTLVVETTGFNDRTWLNSRGAQHGDALHLTERIRPILTGRYLEYTVTADDPKVLAKPYTYTRYYEKLTTEIVEDVCEE